MAGRGMGAWLAWLACLAAAATGTTTAAAVPPPTDTDRPGASPRRLGTIVYLVDGTPSRLSDLARSLQALDLHFNDRYHHPVLIFTPAHITGPDGKVTGSGDSLIVTPEQQRRLRDATRSRLTFADVDFEQYVDPAILAAAAPVVLGRFKLGYRHMCNFFAGPIANHPALAKYRYYWRLDTDSYLVEPVPVDVFAEMARRSWRYGYGSTECDWHVVTEGLYPLAQQVYGAERLDAALPKPFADRSCLRGFSQQEASAAYNNRIVYNNFEVVDLEWLRSPAYQALYTAAAATGQIFHQRWGDAPIRTLAMLATLPPQAVHHFDDISYYHQGLTGPVVRHLVLAGVVAVVALAEMARRCVVPRWRGAARGAGVAAHADTSPMHPATVQLWRAVDTLCCLRIGATLRGVMSGGGNVYGPPSPTRRSGGKPYTLLCCWCRGGGGASAAQVGGVRGRLSRAMTWLAGADGLQAAAPPTLLPTTAWSSSHAHDGGSGTATGTGGGGGEALRRREVGGAAGDGHATAHQAAALGGGGMEGSGTGGGDGGAPASSSSPSSSASPPSSSPLPSGMGVGYGGGGDAVSLPPHHAAALARVVTRMAHLSLLRVGMVCLGVVGLLWVGSRDRLNGTIFPPADRTARMVTGCYPDELQCLLAARADPKRRVVVTAATTGMLDFVRNLLFSLHAVGVRNYLVVALDEGAADYLSAHQVPLYWDPAPLDTFAHAVPAGSEPGQQVEVAGGLAAGLTVSGKESTGNALRFGSDAYRAITMRKNELIYECVKSGYNTLFTDADTVWLTNPLDEASHGPEVEDEMNWTGTTRQDALPPDALRRVRFAEAAVANPYLAHRCAELRLGDSVSAYAEEANTASRADCGDSGAAGLYPYDVKGMYGDVGGMDTGYWYMRATPASIAHMGRVIRFQRTPLGLTMPSDQETFNEMLKPWLPSHLSSADVAAGVTISSTAGFGPSAMRVAMFHPLEAPSGCRLARAERSGVPMLLVHANCRTGWWEKVPWMMEHGVWYVRLWGDGVVWKALLLATTIVLSRWVTTWALAAWRKPLALWRP